MSKPLKKDATYADLCAVPDNFVAEILGGELYASPRPASPHAHAAGALFRKLGGPFEDGENGPGGWWFLIEPELHFGADVLVPDIAGWRRERMPTIPNVAHFTLAPDWLCEVLSPSTKAIDRRKKLPIYAREGVGARVARGPAATNARGAAPRVATLVVGGHARSGRQGASRAVRRDRARAPRALAIAAASSCGGLIASTVAARPPRASRTSIAAPRATVAAVREHLAAGIRHDRIAALERRERAQRLQRARSELQALLRALDLPQQRAAQVALRGAPALARARQPMRRARVRDGRREPRELVACASRCAARRRGVKRASSSSSRCARSRSCTLGLQRCSRCASIAKCRRSVAMRRRVHVARAAARSRAKRLSHSRWSGTASSAACDGVGARRSATKSAIVKSISWPTPTMIGQLDGGDRRARRLSSLNDQRSSSEPPPRVRISTSQSARRSASASVRAISSAAPGALHGCRVDQHGRRRETAGAARSARRAARRPSAR